MTKTDPITSERLAELLRMPVITVPEAGLILGISRTTAFEAARRGEIPTIRVGRSLKVPTAKLRAILGMENAA